MINGANSVDKQVNGITILYSNDLMDGGRYTQGGRAK